MPPTGNARHSLCYRPRQSRNGDVKFAGVTWSRSSVRNSREKSRQIIYQFSSACYLMSWSCIRSRWVLRLRSRNCRGFIKEKKCHVERRKCGWIDWTVLSRIIHRTWIIFGVIIVCIHWEGRMIVWIKLSFGYETTDLWLTRWRNSANLLMSKKCLKIYLSVGYKIYSQR